MNFVLLVICFYVASFHETKADLLWTSCTYIVTPNGTCSDSSPIHVSCNTLDTYVQNSSQYFLSNTTFCFLNGTHVLNIAKITITNISNISFIGFGTSVQRSIRDKINQFNFTDNENFTFFEPTAIIECESFSGFIFNDIINISFINITILNCGANITETLSQIPTEFISMSLVHYVAVLMINVSNLHIEDVSIQNSTGYGLMGINILGQSQITGSSFVGNNQIVRNKLKRYGSTYSYCKDGSSYTTPAIYVGSERFTYAGGNAVIIYDKQSNYSAEPILNINSSFFTLGVDGSIVLLNEIVIPGFQSMGTGLGVFLLQISYTVHITITNTVAYGNQAYYGGNLNFVAITPLFDIFLSNVSSTKGISEFGGSLYFNEYAYDSISHQLKVTNSTFWTEYKPDNGIYVSSLSRNFSMQFEQCIVDNQFVMRSIGYFVTTNTIIFNSTVFSATVCFGGIITYYSTLIVSNCSFSKSNIYGSDNDVYVDNSAFLKTLNSAIKLEKSHLTLKGNVSFINNVANENGGALHLSYTDINFKAPVDIYFVNNIALRGGGIFIRRNSNDVYCPFSFNDPNGTIENPGIHMYFEGNRAEEAGDVLYGGDIDRCYSDCNKPNYCTIPDESPFWGYPYNVVLNATTSCNKGPCVNDIFPSMISSDARSICSCTNSSKNINCIYKHDIGPVYPGQTIHIPIITIGQLSGISPDTILIFTCDVVSGNSEVSCSLPSILGEAQKTQAYCSNYNYQVEGKDNQSYNSVIHLLPSTAFYLGYSTLHSTYFTVSSCTSVLGFVFNETSKICDCSSVLKNNGVRCDINTLKVSKSSTLWIGKSLSGILAVHQLCPYDYCVTTDLTFSLDNEDEQCDHGHSGVLCGKCKKNFSAVFGSARCKPCTSEYVWLVIPILLMGVIVTVLIFLLNCTVSVGTINGIILYANIVRPGIISMLPTNFQMNFEKFLFVFIAWLNLDLGIETCFYDGMSTYAKTWLELLFPLYILALVGAIIIGSRWSSKLAWLCKRNAVPVLATLILLSYTKFFQATIIILLPTKLDTGNPH